jgi:hypothetical protein
MNSCHALPNELKAQANFHKWEVTDSITAAHTHHKALTDESVIPLLSLHTPPDAFARAREETAVGYREMVQSIYPPAVDWDIP